MQITTVFFMKDYRSVFSDLVLSPNDVRLWHDFRYYHIIASYANHPYPNHRRHDHAFRQRRRAARPDTVYT